MSWEKPNVFTFLFWQWLTFARRTNKSLLRHFWCSDMNLHKLPWQTVIQFSLLTRCNCHAESSPPFKLMQEHTIFIGETIKAGVKHMDHNTKPERQSPSQESLFCWFEVGVRHFQGTICCYISCTDNSPLKHPWPNQKTRTSKKTNLVKNRQNWGLKFLR